MKTLSIAIAFTIFMFGCVGEVVAAEKVADATEAEVAKCTFVQDVSGHSVFGERLKEQGLTKSKEDARVQASRAGATHIVWGQISQTDMTNVAGKAYRCPN
jgi:hypothetical protein